MVLMNQSAIIDPVKEEPLVRSNPQNTPMRIDHVDDLSFQLPGFQPLYGPGLSIDIDQAL